MATPNEKLADSLTALRELQNTGARVFRSSEISRVHRERLIEAGFLQEVIKGWVMSASPATGKGDTTPWFASFWEFCARYCEERFGADWHLAPEQSLLLHAEATAIPKQVIIYSPQGANNTLTLLFGTSFYDLKQKEMPPAADLAVKNGLRVFDLAAALIRVPESFFQRNPIEAQVALVSVRSASPLLERLLDGGHSVVASRLVGAFRAVGRKDIADEIESAMRAAHYEIRPSNPFEAAQVLAALDVGRPPIVARIEALWAQSRAAVSAAFPPPPGLPADAEQYMRDVEENYKHDAYHSLSIEGYTVSLELIERVRSGAWNPETDQSDKDNANALAARGYWQAFQAVKETITSILEGKPPGPLVSEAHRAWYREMFQPSVTAGIVPPRALAGYRNSPVFLRGSWHVPPRAEVVPDAMDALFTLLANEPEAAVRAVLGHWLIGYIHPFPDGNGRLARFLMNAMLASGGYPWTIVRKDDRDRYLQALEKASIDNDMGPFATFLAGRVGAPL
ncbi:MAG: Fic family protein [Hyphomonadaceae bacterium]